ncbi:DUF481 domain-containing protein [Sphingosinicella rhizophila]|uniref:DUF481 domain-containing protein n=1 Tax=Sphingosinicella rhizophila TaxID=3050082 RepID=A0ABU3QC30_9SPHN|nr:DUF481 domain-containing protein [Sphingosinicella sp. GR2756]MDT9600553.1 DUF481 domain-containing protein [Sphingosinicella sp. GR2756]
MKPALLMVGLCMAATPALADPLPGDAASLLSRTWERENEAGREALAATLKRAYPESIDEIDARIAELKAKTEAAQAAAKPAPSLGAPTASAPTVTAAADETPPAEAAAKLDGQIELGFSYADAATDTANALVSAKFNASHGPWSHLFIGSVDFNKTSGQSSVERYLASYEVGREIADGPTFAKALLSFERDPLSGYRYRFTQSLGLGSRIDLGEDAVLNIAGGPSARESRSLDGMTDTAFGARATVGFDWQLSPSVTSSSGGSVVIEGGGYGTTEAKTALTAKVVGPLAARLQMSYRNEKTPDFGTRTTTISRASLVYSF